MRTVFLTVALASIMFSGCDLGESIDTGYGRRKGWDHGESVCGTVVLAEMFDHRGHTASSWSYLSPRIDEAETIVWFPDEFSVPRQETRERLERWLSESPGRTLVYVGRDYDAPTLYWKKTLAQTPAPSPADKTEMQSRQTDVETDAAVERESLADHEDCDWFSIDRSKKPKTVQSLDDSPWYDSTDASITPAGLEIEWHHRLIPPRSSSPSSEYDWSRSDLLVSEGEPLVTQLKRYDWGSSQLLIVQNGSFLLNLPLVNHQHRLLAGRLIDEIESCGGAQQQVLFLESGSGGPEILEQDPSSNPPTGPPNEPPMSYVVYHLIVIGVVAIFACWPIWGRPRDLPSAARSDFGQHVRSLGSLLSRSGDETYCRARLLHYEQTSRGESGRPPK